MSNHPLARVEIPARPSPWLLRAPGARGRVVLYCLAHAGGNANAYLPWQAALGSEVEICGVQLPGHGFRLGEKARTSMPELVDEIAAIIAAEPARPFALLGHSLGALLAFEVTRALRRRAAHLPEKLFVSGCAAPAYRRAAIGVAQMDDQGLLALLETFHATPPEVLRHRGLMSLLLPAVRADFTLVDSYRYRPERPLELPLVVLAGVADQCHAGADMAHWQHETGAACAVHWFEGAHFFIQSARREVLALLQAELAAPARTVVASTGGDRKTSRAQC